LRSSWVSRRNAKIQWSAQNETAESHVSLRDFHRHLEHDPLEVIGYDLASSRHTARSYDDQGASELYEVELKGRSWRISGRTARFNGKFDASGNKLTGLWELKGSKSGWQPWIKLKLERAT
jgi:hypothetical protein